MDRKSKQEIKWLLGRIGAKYHSQLCELCHKRHAVDTVEDINFEKLGEWKEVAVCDVCYKKVTGQDFWKGVEL